MTLSNLFLVTLALWTLVGIAWLLSQKLAILKRVGNLTADHLIQLGKAGDVEIQKLRKNTWCWCGIGLALILPQVLALQIVKATG